MSQTQATPRPWHLNRSTDAIAIMGESGLHLSTIAGYGNTEVQNKANAELIVRAVNSYDAMVEALEKTIAFMESELACIRRHSGPQVKLASGDMTTLRNAQTALTLAKKGL